VYQLEKESANIRNDHRKRLIFNAKLQASSMNRFSCFLKPVSTLEKPMNPVQEELHFVNECCEITISTETGLIDQYKVDGVNYLKSDSAELLVMADSADPWGMKVTAFRDLAGRFKLMSPSETAGFTGTNGAVEPVRIIEEGPVRSVVEGLFRFNHSAAAIRYMIPRQGATLEIEVRVIWNEKDKMLKIAFPTFLTNATCQGQVPYGTEIFDQQGDELVAGQWIGLFSRDQDRALTIANRTTYGFDHSEGELRLSLLRSPAYAGHPVDDLTPIVRQDRFTPRMDQGEHIFRFRLAAGNASARLQAADTESRLLNGGSVVLCCHPSGKGRKPASAVRISNSAIRLAALKLAETDDSLVIRLFETTGAHATAILEIPALNLSTPLEFSPFEIKTMLVNRVTKEIRETGLLEHS
jgi:alpha-mannosidase